MHSYSLWAFAAFGAIAAAGVPAPDLFAKQPLQFEADRGRSGEPGRYLAQGPNFRLAISNGAIELVGGGRTHSRAVMRFVAANPKAAVEGVEPLPTRTNYFLGTSQGSWRRDVPNYGKVRIAGLYPGIDLIFYGSAGKLEYDFVAAPGSHPEAIEFAVEGANRVSVDGAGSLALETEAGKIVWKRPDVYQGAREHVDGRFSLSHGNRRVRFHLGRYDRRRTLVIDPVLDYVTYLGGAGNDFTRAMGADGAGNVYIGGVTSSQGWKVSSTALQTSYGGETADNMTGDAFIAKFGPNGALLWTTFLGGQKDDFILGLAVDSAGSVYVAGYTNSRDFPVTKGVLQSAYRGGAGNTCNPLGDAFVAKINPTGNQLVYATYLGGSADDLATAIAIDQDGNAYVTGATLSRDFPTTAGVLQSNFAGLGGQVSRPNCNNTPAMNVGDAFVAKLNPTATQLVWATYLGGRSDDAAMAIAVDGNNNVYVGGLTLSTDFPTKNPVQSKFGGIEPQNEFSNYGDGFVAKLNSAATALLYSTYLGGNGDDAVFGIFVDASGTAYVTGSTSSQNFPVTAKAVQAKFGGYYNLPFLVEQNFGDAFVTRFSVDGSLLYSTFLGGQANEIGSAIQVDSNGLIYVVGSTDSGLFPVTAATYQKALAGDGGFGNYVPIGDGFFAIIDPTSTSLVYSTYFGGARDDWFSAMAFDAAGNLWIAGGTLSTDIKSTANAAQKAYGGDRPSLGPRGDALLVRFSGLTAAPALPLTISKTSQSAAGAGNPVRGDAFTYTIQVNNTGASAASAVTIVDTPDARPELVLQGPLKFNVGALAAAGVNSTTISASASAVGMYTNTATVSWTDGSGRTSTATATAKTQVDPLPGDQLAQAAAPLSLNTGVAQLLADGPSLYVANNPGDSLTILNCDAGTCKTSSTVPLGANAKPVALAKLDVDGDGANDIVILNQGTGTISTILSRDRGNLFSNAPKVSAIGAGGIALAPFAAGDGTPRVAVLFLNRVAIFSWDGQKFQPGAVAVFAGTPSAMINGDFNGDGIDDLLVADNAGGNVQLFLGDGAGGLNLVSTQPVGNGPVALAAGDFDNNGSLDVAAVTADGLIMLINDGGGNFAPQSAVPASGGGALALGDFDGDGNLDVAVAISNGASVTFYRGDGAGGLTAAGAYLVGQLPVSVVVADVNGDGVPDVIAGAAGTRDLTILVVSNP